MGRHSHERGRIQWCARRVGRAKTFAYGITLLWSRKKSLQGRWRESSAHPPVVNANGRPEKLCAVYADLGGQLSRLSPQPDRVDQVHFCSHSVQHCPHVGCVMRPPDGMPHPQVQTRLQGAAAHFLESAGSYSAQVISSHARKSAAGTSGFLKQAARFS